MHPQHEVDEALRLVAEGLNDCQIARVTGISRTTIREWRRYGPPGRRAGRRTSVCPRCDGRPLDEPAYAYLLGLYLGDGHISKIRSVYRLRIFQDERYVFLIALAGEAILRVRAGHGKVSNVPQMGCVAVSAYWRHWPCVFPQHGPGLKHRRPIELASWQVRLVSAYPHQLVRGLVHSDGCRVVNRVWKGKYAYPRTSSRTCRRTSSRSSESHATRSASRIGTRNRTPSRWRAEPTSRRSIVSSVPSRDGYTRQVAGVAELV